MAMPVCSSYVHRGDGKESPLWDGEDWELPGASEIRSCSETQLLWVFVGVTGAMQHKGHPLGGKKGVSRWWQELDEFF